MDSADAVYLYDDKTCVSGTPCLDRSDETCAPIGPESNVINFQLFVLAILRRLPVPASRYLSLRWNVSPEYPEAWARPI